MARDLKYYKSSLGGIKARVTIFRNKLNDEPNLELSELESMLNRLRPLYDKFDDRQTEIDILESTDGTAARHEFENNYGEIEASIMSRIKRLQISNKTSAVQLPQSQVSVPTIPIPPISLPKFDGNYYSWLDFRKIFTELVHSNEAVSSVVKFHFLRQCLEGGQAFHFIEGIPATPDNYKEVWDSMFGHFENDTRLKFYHMRELYYLKPLKDDNNARTLQVFINSIFKQYNALKSLNIPVDQWELYLIFHICELVDPVSRQQIEIKKTANEMPSFHDVMDILTKRARLLESMECSSRFSAASKTSTNWTNKSSTGEKKTQNFVVADSPSPTNLRCTYCKETHSIFKCATFEALLPTQRSEWISNHNLCLKCFGKHPTKKCKSINCKICQYPHNTLLHFKRMQPHQRDTTPKGLPSSDNVGSSVREQVTANMDDIHVDSDSITIAGTPSTSYFDSTKESVCHSSTANHTTSFVTNNPQILLSTAVLWAYNKFGVRVPCRALIDSGSQSNFVTNEFCQILGLRKNSELWSVSGIGDSKMNSIYRVEVSIESRLSDYRRSVNCLVLPKITNELPVQIVKCDLRRLPLLELGDPNFYKPQKIDMLLGAEVYAEVIGARVELSAELPPFMKSSLGYIVCGKMPDQVYQSNTTRNTTSLVCCDVDLLSKQIQKFWHIENLQTQNNFSLEEKNCEKHYTANVKRDIEGRYTVALPTKPNLAKLGDSYKSAVQQFHRLERRFDQNPELHKQYSAFMQEYIDLGHMSCIQSHQQSNDKVSFYMPHHAVFKESSTTTKLRVVFNASAKSSSGLTLNDTLMTGATIQPDLFSIVIGFRKHRIALTADITKMYRQILVRASDRSLQQIVWRQSPNEPIATYQLNTVTYGTASAPFLAIRSLQQLAQDEFDKYPAAACVLLTNFYVDDLLAGANSVEDALQLKSDLIALLKCGGFDLRKWASNDNTVASDSENQGNIVSTLGVKWDSENDVFQLVVDKMSSEQQFTKRVVLAQIMKLFDPLGLVGPVVFSAKLFMQKLWSIPNLSWDAVLDDALLSEWRLYIEELPIVNEIKIPRCVVPFNNLKSIELHGFGDASEKGFGACLYIRTFSNCGGINSQLLCSKSKVAPLKKLTIPRLELCAALLLAQLYEKVSNCIDIKFDKVVLWSDSEITLHRIYSAPAKYATFVANRVSQIQDIAAPSWWSYIPTNINPADLVSRGLSPTEIQTSELWWHGPTFLSAEDVHFPIRSFKSVEGLEDVELVAQKCSTLSSVTNKYDLVERYSNLCKLLRISAICLRFLKLLKNKVLTSKNSEKEPCPISQNITATELDEAMNSLILGIQRTHFSDEIKQITCKKLVHKRSPLSKLCPFIDNKGLLRVGGRLDNSNLSIERKHPVILPAKHKLSILIIRNEHIKHLHSGPQSLLSYVRQKYWIVGARTLCKNIVHQCVTCFRIRPKSIQQIMGELPSERVTAFRAFENTGVDFCGPFQLKSKVRSNVTTKGYICLFVCFSSKATHLEVVTELSTSAFLAALRRFASRRGRPSRLFSDNATNFVGARRELQDLYKLFTSETHKIEVLKHCSEEGIIWSTIPPRSPHFGGLWESAIKNAKHHLKRVAGNQTLTLEELSTLVVQIEACLNSRPLTPLSEDPSDLSVLTPGHFLIGGPINAIPEPSLLYLDFNRLSRYQRLQYAMQIFWQRWADEYLSELQQRHKWSQPTKNLSIGDLVLMKEDNTPPLKWIMARVIELHPGKDNNVRVVTVKTSSGNFKRAVTRLCLLPLERPDSDLEAAK